MSFIYNNEIKYSDSQNLDAFGRLRTSNVTSLLEYKHTFDKLPLVINEVTAGTATSIFDLPNSQVVMTTSNNNDYVIRQGKSRGIYQPGKGQLVELSFSNFQIETNVIKRVGYFTTSTTAPYNTVEDGFLLESNGQNNTISFQVWHSGVTVVSATTTSWLTNDINVSQIDWTKTQLMFTDFQWLGVGRIRFGLVLSGSVKTFVTYTAANNLSTVYMKAPNQPIRYEIRQVGAGSGTFNMICSQVSLEGSINALQRSLGIPAFANTTATTAGVKYPLIGYRLNQGYEGVNITLSDVQSINTTTPSKSDYYITIELNPTLSSSATFTGVTNSGVAYSLPTGQTVTSSGYILATFLGSGGATQVDDFQFQDNMIRPGVNVDGTYDEVWLCVVSQGNNQTFKSALNLSYYL
jgi:hypothetical protein